MDSLGMILDLSHLGDDGMTQCLKHFRGPVVATHHNCRTLYDDARCISDEYIKAVVERGGVIGTMMSVGHLYREAVHGPLNERTKRELVSLEDFVNHIDHVCQIAGNALHAGIGADTDGQGGRAGTPREIDSIVDYQKLTDMLARRGYGQADIENVMYRNWARVLKASLP